MPSPFPGIDPWIESQGLFPDLHATLITYIGDELNAVLPEPYYARTATRVWIEEDHTRDPDISLYDPSRQFSKPAADTSSEWLEGGMVALATDVASDPMEQSAIEIVSTRGDRLVTAIEILSPTNKTPGRNGRDQYRLKQNEYLAGGSNLLEMDLLRGGQHTTLVSLARLRSAFPDSVAHTVVTLATNPKICYVAASTLEQPLSALRIPLDPQAKPIRLELQPLVNRCYDRRNYSRQLRYDRPCDPPLTAEQKAWADAVLKSKGIL